MPGIRRCMTVLFLLAGCGSMAGAQSPPSSAEPGTTSTVQGVFTEAQAARGAHVQMEMCSMCHFPEDEWREGFIEDWTGRSALELFQDIRKTMPEDFPDSLSRQQYTDVLAYIFQLNGMPAGPSELKTDDASLDRILIERGKP